MMRINRCNLLPFALLLPCPLFGDVIFVDDSGGVGIDFTAIQPAVNAAMDGDVVVVRPGNYPGFTINGKGVSVVAETGVNVNLQNEITVRNLPVGSQVSLVGLWSIATQPNARGLVASNNLGSLWVEDCILRGKDAIATGLWTLEAATPGLFAVNCSDLIVLDCEVVGGKGWSMKDEDFEPYASDGADALLADGGELFIYGGSFRGGNGGSNYDTVSTDGGRGGDALHLDNQPIVYVEGAQLTGGRGGSADEDFFACGNGGRGGHGVYGVHVLEVVHRACTFVPGLGGGAGGSQCSAGLPGSNVHLFGGTETAHPGIAKRLNVQVPVLSGGTATIDVVGQPSDLVWAQTALPLDPTYFPSVTSPNLVSLPRRLVFLGACDATGHLTRVLPMPTLHPGEDFRRHMQGYFRDTSGQGRLGSGAHLIVLP